MSRQSQALSVVIIGTTWPTVGGVASAIEDQRAALERVGLRVRIVNTGERRRTEPNAVRLENVTAVFRDVGRVFRSIGRGREPLAAIHTTGSPILPLLRVLALVLATRLAGARVVLHLHGYDFESEVARAGRAYRLVGWAVGRLTSAVVALHPAMARAAESLFPTRVVVVPNGVAVRPLPSDGVERTRARRALFVGTVGRRKGLLELLEATRLSQVPVDVVGGPGEESMDAHQEVLAAGRDMAETGLVVFHGEVPRTRVQTLLESTSVFILPSHAEGLPVSLLEAMERGVPVVVTDVGGMGALVRSSGCGIVVAVGDAGGIASATERIVSDGALRRRMGDAARRAIVETHNQTSVSTALVDVYRAAACRGRERDGCA